MDFCETEPILASGPLYAALTSGVSVAGGWIAGFGVGSGLGLVAGSCGWKIVEETCDRLGGALTGRMIRQCIEGDDVVDASGSAVLWTFLLHSNGLQSGGKGAGEGLVEGAR